MNAGERLEISLDERRLPPAPSTATSPGIEVLYQDDSLVAVAKPAGLPAHATADPARCDLYSMVQRQLGLSAQPAAVPTPVAAVPPALSYLGLHQRLDRDTSGVVLFTRSPSANASLARQFEDHSIEKVYHALTVRPARRPADRWSVSSSLEPAGKGKRSRTTSVVRGGVAARTDCVILEDFGSALLVEARPLTGRKHQVRAHLAECGAPILGDQRYGGPPRIGRVQVHRSMLHARRLILRHPATSRELRLECPYPEDFQQLLSTLRARRGRRP